MDERRFVLRPLIDTTENDSKASPRELHKKRLETLNISVSPPGGVAAQPLPIQQATVSTGLLAIAPPLTAQALLSSDMYAMGMFPRLGLNEVPAQHAAQVNANNDRDASRSTSASDVPKGSVTPSTDDTENVDVTRVPNEKIVQKEKETYCFLCGYHCTAGRKYRLSSHSVGKPSSDHALAPFFPFLAQTQGSMRSRRLSRHGRVDTCMYCYYNLMWQWNLYERLSGEDRHTRKYHGSAFFCVLCRGSVTRESVTHMSVDDIAGGQEILNCGEVVLVGEKAILVCQSCKINVPKNVKRVKEEVDSEPLAEDKQVGCLLLLARYDSLWLSCRPQLRPLYFIGEEDI